MTDPRLRDILGGLHVYGKKQRDHYLESKARAMAYALCRHDAAHALGISVSAHDEYERAEMAITEYLEDWRVRVARHMEDAAHAENFDEYMAGYINP